MDVKLESKSEATGEYIRIMVGGKGGGVGTVSVHDTLYENVLINPSFSTMNIHQINI